MSPLTLCYIELSHSEKNKFLIHLHHTTKFILIARQLLHINKATYSKRTHKNITCILQVVLYCEVRRDISFKGTTKKLLALDFIPIYQIFKTVKSILPCQKKAT